MRTTIDLDDDLLRVAKSLARQRSQSLGRVLSDYFRRALRQSSESSQSDVRNGVPLLPRHHGAPPITAELVRELRDADE